MKKQYEPEMGQALFGNEWSSFDCPDFVTAGLLLLEHEIERVEWNIQQKHFSSPLGGGIFEPPSCDVYKNKVFIIRSYYWGESKWLKSMPNFKCGDFEVRWYKHFGRGMSMNKNIDANQFFVIIDKCMKFLARKDKNNFDGRIKKAEKVEKNAH